MFYKLTSNLKWSHWAVNYSKKDSHCFTTVSGQLSLKGLNTWVTIFSINHQFLKIALNAQTWKTEDQNNFRISKSPKRKKTIIALHWFRNFQAADVSPLLMTMLQRIHRMHNSFQKPLIPQFSDSQENIFMQAEIKVVFFMARQMCCKTRNKLVIFYYLCQKYHNFCLLSHQ